MFTLFFCFLGILFYDNIQNIISRWVAVFGCIMATWWCDWGITAVLYTLALWIFREDSEEDGDRLLRCVGFLFLLKFSYSAGARAWLCSQPVFMFILCWEFSWHSFLFCLLIGEKGRFLKGAIGKWFFYFFYPVHLLLIALI